MRQLSLFVSLMPSVSPKRKIMGFSGLLFLKRSVGAPNQLLRGYFCSSLIFAKNPISVPNQVLWIFGSMRAPATRCCSHLEISKHKLENMLLKYVACPDIGAWVILSTSRYLFSFEMIKVLCSLSPEMLAANYWFCFINYCHWSTTSIELRSAVITAGHPTPVWASNSLKVQGLCLKTKINK